MKLQYLIIIFLLIMTPIYLVFSRYIDVQMEKINIQNTYDIRLREATYDAVKAFQTNTINSFLYVPETRVKFSKASVNSFFTSLNLAFGYNGESKTLMNGYVPAVVLTMYDGYYIYAPFVNELTNVKDEDVDEDYKDQTTLTELKPYITYSCRYKKENNTEYIITYSLDNYIIVDESNGSMHKRHEGYLIGLNQYTDIQGYSNYDNPESITSFEFNGITFSKDTKEKLSEYLIDENGEGAFYFYTIRNGTKYYYGTTDANGKIIHKDLNEPIGDDNTTDVIFYINDSGVRVNQVFNYKDNKEDFNSYYNSIKENTLAFEYYRDAYVFSKWVESELAGITKDNIVSTINYDRYGFTDVGNIFGEINNNIEDSDSKFNQHRKDVIRAVIQTNLSTAISGFSTYSQAEENIQFIMPKISEENWELLENNVCIATFLQGFPIGSKTYNGYAVVPNTKTKEFVDEEDIYVLKDDNTYAKVNEQGVSLKSDTSGVWRINFEIKNFRGRTYIPTCYTAKKPYLESYNTMMGTNLESYTDIYKYIRKETTPDAIKSAYYIGLGRERKGTFRFTNY